MKFPNQLTQVVPIEKMAGEDRAETRMLRGMLEGAEKYISSFKWAGATKERFFGYGIGGVVAVFLFKFVKNVSNGDEWIWVINGDLPSAYLVTDEIPDSVSALGVYCDLMENWCNAVLRNSSLEDVFPVSVAPTSEHATMLLSRIKFIRENIIPNILKK